MGRGFSVTSTDVTTYQSMVATTVGADIGVILRSVDYIGKLKWQGSVCMVFRFRVESNSPFTTRELFTLTTPPHPSLESLPGGGGGPPKPGKHILSRSDIFLDTPNRCDFIHQKAVLGTKDTRWDAFWKELARKATADGLIKGARANGVDDRTVAW